MFFRLALIVSLFLRNTTETVSDEEKEDMSERAKELNGMYNHAPYKLGI